MGLRGAIGEMIRDYNDAHNVCRFAFASEGNFAHLNSDLTISFYRLIQEASSNILNHAEAKTLNIALNMNAEKTSLSISIVLPVSA
jgi:glucose-6-phosphate-specific signal transduction histidine kinase